MSRCARWIDGAVEMIGDQRTARAARFPAGAEHEVIDDELAFAAEQIGEVFLAVRSVEHVTFFDLFPRQFAAFPAQFVAGAAERLFLEEIGLARRDPFVMRYDLVRLHGLLLFCSFSPRAGRGYQFTGVIQPIPAPPGS